VFELYGNDRLVAWKKFRDSLEISKDPFKDTLGFWRRAPYVFDFLEKIATTDWPNPWRLIIDGKYDNLAINLGILYTLQLTKRFMNSDLEIHRNIGFKQLSKNVVVIDRDIVVDYNDDKIYHFNDLINTSVLYSSGNK
jgi:hypothetical protein